jgi:pSer/pThr/pTyr-binding forkhead associated (FHA) protein
MPAQLVALSEGPSILVDKPILLLGRHPECDIQIESRKISRRHCCIAQVNDYLVVRDLDSTNGIRINGVRVTEGKLAPGDELTIGNHRYQVTWDEGPAHPVSRPAPRKVVAPPPQAAMMSRSEDEILESCDEPIPLPDPNRPVPGSTRPPISSPASDESILLPENLELLPNSGSLPGAGTARPPGEQ